MMVGRAYTQLAHCHLLHRNSRSLYLMTIMALVLRCLLFRIFSSRHFSLLYEHTIIYSLFLNYFLYFALGDVGILK
uniref:Uncharacterized protein n=1 Tax=Arundo donax TaxID=35708 RepID=A0A0A9DL49_ARUDO